MLKDFILPDIGEGIVECEIVEWLVKEGDPVTEDQPLVELMTDKAVVEIPSTNTGTVIKHYYQKGEIAIVHTPLFSIEVDDSEENSMDLASVSQSDKKTVLETKQTSDPEIKQSTLPKETNNKSIPLLNKAEGRPAEGRPAEDRPKVLTTPAIRRIAREMNIDLKTVLGSGKNGRVLKSDLDEFHQNTAQPSPQSALNSNRVEPLKGVKLAMAKAMVESASTIPHFIYSDEIDVTNLVELRNSIKQSVEKEGVKLTLMPFFLKSLALAVQEFPIMNSQLNLEVTEIHYQPSINIGVAVDSEIGLLVPNIKNVETLSILDITKELNRLTKAARNGKVSQKDLQGGTITISNIGALGGTVASPIINKPEVAIMALGKIQSLPRFNEKNEVVARQIMQVSWAGDHRIIDGGTIARCSNLWIEFVEHPSKMLLYMR